MFPGNFFKNSNVNDSGISLPVFPFGTNLKLHNVYVTPKMARKVIMNLDLSNTSGSDCVPVMVLKNCEPKLSCILAEIWPNGCEFVYKLSNLCERALETAKLAYANRTKGSINFEKPGSWDFRQTPDSILKKVKSAIPPLFNDPEVLSSASDEGKLFPETFFKNSYLNDQVSLYLFSLLELI